MIRRTSQASHDGWSLGRFDANDVDARALWRELCIRSGGSLVQQPEFVFTCAATLGPPGLRLAVHRRSGEVTAAAILTGRRVFTEVFVASQMPLGAWLQTPSESLTTLGAALLGRIPLALRLGISQVDTRFVARPESSETINTIDYFETPWLRLEGNFDGYWAARGKNLKTNMRRQRDKLLAQRVALRMEVLSAPEDMERAVSTYGELESRGWKVTGGTAIGEGHPQTRFYREMLERFAERGEARVYRYFFGDRLVACELCLCGSGEFVILKTTYDEATAPFSPASLMRQEMLADLFSTHAASRLEFYGPLKEWHTRWTGERRALYHVNLHSTATAARLVRLVKKALPAAALKAEQVRGTTTPEVTGA